MLRRYTLILLYVTCAISCHGVVLPRLAPGVLDTADVETMGLHAALGTETMTVFSPTAEGDDHYANGVVMTAWQGWLYCMWQSSARDEDTPDTWVACSRSSDGGRTWSHPTAIVRADSTASYTSGGWICTGDTLVAMVNRWPHTMEPRGGQACWCATADGETWSEPQAVLMADGKAMQGVIEQDIHVAASGRLHGQAHFQPGLHVCPIYTNDQSGRTGWHRGEFTDENRGKQSRCLEPSLYQRTDGTLVMVLRDQRSSYRKMVSMSSDDGLTWTAPELTNIPDARVKQSAGNLPDGTCYMAANPTGTKRRWPLALLLSSDGTTFSHAYLLRSGAQDLPARRYEGKAKTLGYSYPKSFVYQGWLYVAYSTNKEDVQFTRVPLSSISLTRFSKSL